LAEGEPHTRRVLAKARREAAENVRLKFGRSSGRNQANRPALFRREGRAPTTKPHSF